MAQQCDCALGKEDEPRPLCEEQVADTETELLLYGLCDIVAMLVCLLVVLKMQKKQAVLDGRGDAAMISMSDYTVLLRPSRPWKLGGRGQADFKARLQAHVQQLAGPVATVPHTGQVCIWLAFFEEKRIGLWRQKVAALLGLEKALKLLGDCEENDHPAVDRVLAKVAKVNAQLEGEAKHVHGHGEVYVAAAFVSFESAMDCENMLAGKYMPQHKGATEGPLEFAEETFRAMEAGEPDTIIFEHQQYSERQHSWRQIISLAFTMAVLGGAAVISIVLKNNTPVESLHFCEHFEEDFSEPYTSDFTKDVEFWHAKPNHPEWLHESRNVCDGATGDSFAPAVQEFYKHGWETVRKGTSVITFPSLVHLEHSIEICDDSNFVAFNDTRDLCINQTNASDPNNNVCQSSEKMRLDWSDASAAGCVRKNDPETLPRHTSRCTPPHHSTIMTLPASS